MQDETTVPTPDDSTPSGAEHPFEPSPTEDAAPSGEEASGEPGEPDGPPPAAPGR